VDDDALAKLIEAAKLSVGREHGLDDAASRRLAGSTVDELHTDAKAMAREVGAHDPTERERARDDGGRFRTVGDAVGLDMNQLIRQASGR
jgi:hypothetical protein